MICITVNSLSYVAAPIKQSTVVICIPSHFPFRRYGELYMFNKIISFQFNDSSVKMVISISSANFRSPTTPRMMQSLYLITISHAATHHKKTASKRVLNAAATCSHSKRIYNNIWTLFEQHFNIFVVFWFPSMYRERVNTPGRYK